MSDNGSGFFTRADWRPSKKRRMRKRVNHYGGCKTAPPAFLEAGKRHGFKPGRVGVKLCTATKRAGGPCGNVALSGLNVCGYHGGYSVWARQGKLQPSERSAAFRATAVAERAQPTPLELAQMRVYQEANQWDRVRLIKAWGSGSWARLVKTIQQRQSTEP